MFQNIKESTVNQLNNLGSPFTNVYGLARTILALSSIMTLMFNEVSTLFKPVAGIEEYPFCSTGISRISAFCILPVEFLPTVKIIVIFLLLLVASGWRPRITGVIHWWVAFSIQNSMTTLDGGDQVISVLTFLLLPITLGDKRKWHWERKTSVEESKVANAIAWAAIFVIQLQIAILYLHSSIAKLFNAEWVNGTAVYYYINDPMFGVNPKLMTLIEPIVESWLIIIPTWGTIVLQLLLFCGLFANYKIKKILFLLAIFMHEIFAIMLGLISFSTAMIAALILYLEPLNKEYKILLLERR
jgi:antimicrobial peptide system SdpB family protein